MGKYIKKCNGIGEIAVMDVEQVGVRTKARALAMDAAAAESSGPAKRRRVGGGELEFSSSLVQLKSHRQLQENSVSAGYSTDQCSSPSSDHVSASCCSSNGSTEVSTEELSFADLEQEESLESETATYNFDCRGRKRRETTPLSELGAETGELEPIAKPSEANSRRQSSTAKKMPSEAELEEFFAVAEKDLQKQFTDKYNYDIATDKPLEGRYEWVRLKQWRRQINTCFL